jgi:hypothetical protein
MDKHAANNEALKSFRSHVEQALATGPSSSGAQSETTPTAAP